jgi:hypothetical protein
VISPCLRVSDQRNLPSAIIENPHGIGASCRCDPAIASVDADGRALRVVMRWTGSLPRSRGGLSAQVEDLAGLHDVDEQRARRQL